MDGNVDVEGFMLVVLTSPEAAGTASTDGTALTDGTAFADAWRHKDANYKLTHDFGSGRFRGGMEKVGVHLATKKKKKGKPA